MSDETIAGEGDAPGTEVPESATDIAAEPVDPETLRTERDQVRAERDEARAERDEYKDIALRLQADFENYKKRVASVQADEIERAASKVKVSVHTCSTPPLLRAVMAPHRPAVEVTTGVVAVAIKLAFSMQLDTTAAVVKLPASASVRLMTMLASSYTTPLISASSTLEPSTMTMVSPVRNGSSVS